MSMLAQDGPGDVRQEFLDAAEGDVRPPRNGEALRSIGGGGLAWRAPGPGQECSRSGSAYLREGKAAGTVVAPGENAALDGIPWARPECVLAGIEVAVVFVQGAAQAPGDGALNRVLPEDISVSLAVTGCALLPFLRLVFCLVDASRGGDPYEAERVHQAAEIKVAALGECERMELARRFAGHVEEIEYVAGEPGTVRAVVRLGGRRSRRGGSLRMARRSDCDEQKQ